MRYMTVFCSIFIFRFTKCGWTDRGDSTESLPETGDSSTGNSSKTLIDGTKTCADTGYETDARMRYHKSLDYLDDIYRIFHCDIFRAHRGLKDAQVSLQSAMSTLENYEYYLRIVYRKTFQSSGKYGCSIQGISKESQGSALPNATGSSPENPEYDFPSIKSHEEIVTEALEKVTVALKAIDELSELPKLEKKGESKHRGKLRSLPGMFATSLLKQAQDDTASQKTSQGTEGDRNSASSTDDPNSPLQMVIRGSPWNSPSKKPKDDE